MTRSRWTLATALVAVVLLTGGCGGNDPAPAVQSTSPSSPPTTTSTSSSPTALSVTPAGGLQLTEASSSIRVPAGWRKLPAVISYASSAGDRRHLNSVQLVDSGDITLGADLDTQAQSALHNLPKGARATRMPDIELAGVPAFHIHYTVPGDRFEYDSFTALRNTRNVGLDFILDKQNASANPGLIDSVLATFRWIA